MGRKSNAEAKRKELVEEYYQLSSEIGLENASIAAIANKLGVRKSNITYYFPAKDDLTLGLVDFVTERYLAILKDAWKSIDNPDDIVQNIIDTLFAREWKDQIDGRVFFACYYLSLSNERVRLQFVKCYNSLRIHLENIFSDAFTRSGKEVPNISLIANFIMSLLEGTDMLMNVYDNEFYMEEMTKAVSSLMEKIINEPKTFFN